MLPRVLRLHPGTYQRLLRLSKEAERDGAYRVAKRLQAVLFELPRTHQRRVGRGSTSAAFQGFGMVGSLSSPWRGGLARGATLGKACRVDCPSARTAGRYPRQWSGRLRLGHGSVDLAHDCLGDRGGVWRPLSSGPCTQAPACNGFLRATSPAGLGPSRSCAAGPLAPPDLSRS